MVPTNEYFSMHMSEGAEILKLAMLVYLSGRLSLSSCLVARFSRRSLVSGPRESSSLHLEVGTGPFLTLMGASTAEGGTCLHRGGPAA